MKIGTIEAIWRYPIKGMAGEKLNHCELDAAGLKGDRIWAVQDVQRQEIQSCKFRPQLLQCRAQSIGDKGSGQTKITFPNGREIDCDDPEASNQVSKLLGYESLLQALRPAADDDFYKRYKKDEHTWLEELKATFTRDDGEPLPDLDNLPQAMQDYVSILGTFFLVSPFHILTTASMKHMKHQEPDSDWNIERFRPNIVIETLPFLEGLVEQDWIKKRLKIGDIIIDCNETVPRCGAVVRKQSGFDEDKRILRSIVNKASQNLGIYGNISNEGVINIGDDVYLV